MLFINLMALDATEKQNLSEMVQASTDGIRIFLTIPALFSSSSLSEIARSRLALWYIAELLAELGSGIDVATELADQGAGDARFVVNVHSPEVFVEKILWLADVFDPDGDGEAYCEFMDKISDWAEDETKPVRFPDLRQDYEHDAETAADHEYDFGE